MASSPEKPDVEASTPTEAVTQEAADAIPIQIMVWHVHAGAASEATLRDAEKVLADAIRETDLRPEITCIGTTCVGAAPTLTVPSADLGELSEVAEQAVLLIHSPLRSNSPEDFHEDLDLNSEGDLHDKDEVSAALVKTTEIIWKHAKRVRDMTLVATGRAISAAEMRRFGRAKEEAFESSPKNEHLRQLGMKKDLAALREHLLSTVLAATDSRKERRFTFAALVFAFVVGFVSGVASNRTELAVAEPEIVEKISIVPEIRRAKYEQVGEWSVATLRYSHSERDYACLLAGYDETASYWLCPLPDSWRDIQDKRWENWESTKIPAFKPGGVAAPKTPPPVQVLARLPNHLLVAYWERLPCNDMNSAKLIDLVPNPELSTRAPEAVRQAQALFPELRMGPDAK